MDKMHAVFKLVQLAPHFVVKVIHDLHQITFPAISFLLLDGIYAARYRVTTLARWYNYTSLLQVERLWSFYGAAIIATIGGGQ